MAVCQVGSHPAARGALQESFHYQVRLVNVLHGASILAYGCGYGADAHGTAAEPGSWLSGLYGARFPVNSAHHQAVDRVGEGLVVDQRSEDGVIEAMHHRNGRVFTGQWHPERMCFRHRREDTVDGSIVLQWFLRQCEACRG